MGGGVKKVKVFRGVVLPERARKYYGHPLESWTVSEVEAEGFTGGYLIKPSFDKIGRVLSYEANPGKVLFTWRTVPRGALYPIEREVVLWKLKAMEIK